MGGRWIHRLCDHGHCSSKQQQVVDAGASWALHGLFRCSSDSPGREEERPGSHGSHPLRATSDDATVVVQCGCSARCVCDAACHLAPWAILEDRTVTECIGQHWAHQQGTHQVYDHIHESYIQRNFLYDDVGLIRGALRGRSAITYKSAMS